jgi:probable F420-dependent oxidoreductase
MTPKPFRFGLEFHHIPEGATWADSAREAEDLGYSTLFVPDHIHNCLGPIAAMAAAAAATTELRVGPLVLDCDYRHPAFVAKELATIDLLSGGRLEVGLGAGWKAEDYRKAGIAMDRPGVRVSRMIEHADILRRLLRGETVDHDGEHYRIEDLTVEPLPASPGGPPFLIGGGAPRVLRFAGSFADIVGINPSIHSGEIDADAARDGQADRIDQKVAWVREGAGDRFDDLEINCWLAIAQITHQRRELADALAPAFGVTAEMALQSPIALIGSVDEVIEDLRARRERWGYSYIVLPETAMRDFAPVVAALAGT